MIKVVISFLVMLGAILGAVLVFLQSLPPTEAIISYTAIIFGAVAVIAAMIRALERFAEEVATEARNSL